MRSFAPRHSKPIEDLQATITIAIDALSRFRFDTIACIGASGILIGPILAYELGKKFAYVRKEDEKCHGCGLWVGSCGTDYVIIDDLIASGNSMRRVIETLTDSKCVGIYLYDGVATDCRLNELQVPILYHQVADRKLILRQPKPSEKPDVSTRPCIRHVVLDDIRF